MAKKDFDVGYGKPPKSGQFKPGQSGNPKGRPKGAKNLKTVLEEEFLAKVPIKEQGKFRKVSKQEAMVKAVIQKAMQGDVKAFNALMTAAGKYIGEALQETEGDELHPIDLEILEEFRANVIKENEAKKNGKK